MRGGEGTASERARDVASVELAAFRQSSLLQLSERDTCLPGKIPESFCLLME